MVIVRVVLAIVGVQGGVLVHENAGIVDGAALELAVTRGLHSRELGVASTRRHRVVLLEDPMLWVQNIVGMVDVH